MDVRTCEVCGRSYKSHLINRHKCKPLSKDIQVVGINRVTLTSRKLEPLLTEMRSGKWEFISLEIGRPNRLIVRKKR